LKENEKQFVIRLRKDIVMVDASNTTAPTQFIETRLEKYAYRRFGKGAGLPLLCLQHFTGTLDNWDPSVTDPLALGREVILFESAGVGRSTGEVPDSVPGMATRALAFVDALGLEEVDLLGFSLGGMVAQEIALERPSLVRRMLLVATAPEGGEDIMHLEKPELKKIIDDSNLPGLQKLVKLFFAPSESSQAAGAAFVARLAQRRADREPISGPNVAMAQITAFRAWEQFSGERFAKLRKIGQPCLVVNGVFDNMIPVRNSYMLSEHLPNAMLLTYPDAGHGSLFQFHDSFVRQASLFLNSEVD
jgi:pimeloyl-ACP methyl ester carboxylesterase